MVILTHATKKIYTQDVQRKGNTRTQADRQTPTGHRVTVTHRVIQAWGNNKETGIVIKLHQQAEPDRDRKYKSSMQQTDTQTH
jgi:hypothetical protein